MKKSDRLKSIIDIESRQEQAVLQVLVQLRAKAQDMESQLENLKAYKQGYLQKHANEASMSIGTLMEFRAFIAKLDQAIEGQVQAMETHQQELDKAQQAWEYRHHKVSGLQKICEHAVNQENHRQQKAEQAELDERAGRPTRESGM